ncbi:hypothetical protein Tco_0215615, partial [Tanacetum coccineum]
RQALDTQEYPSLIDTFWRTHTVDGVFPKDEDRRIYEEMKRLEATGEYKEDEINALARGGKLCGHIPGVGRVLLKSMHRKVDFMMSLFRSDSKYSDMFKEFESGGASGSGGCGDDEESGDDEDGEDEDDDGERFLLMLLSREAFVWRRREFLALILAALQEMSVGCANIGVMKMEEIDVKFLCGLSSNHVRAAEWGSHVHILPVVFLQPLNTIQGPQLGIFSDHSNGSRSAHG